MNTEIKTCLVTGASSGIGRCICQILTQKNYQVIGIARREDLLNELKTELGEKFIPFKCDVANVGEVKQVSEQLKAQGIIPEIFFLNAGYGYNEEVEQFEYDLHKTTFEVNYFGVINFVDAWLAEMLKAGRGNFVAVSSLIAFIPMPDNAAYGASKAAVAYAFESLNMKYHPCNVKFSIVYPGPVDTALLKVDKPMPFTWTPEKAAKSIVKKALKNRRKIFFSIFWRNVLRLHKILPDWFVFKMFRSKKHPSKDS